MNRLLILSMVFVFLGCSNKKSDDKKEAIELAKPTRFVSNYLTSTGAAIQPKELFLAGAPIDLLVRYKNTQKTIKKNFSEPT
jgi:hypothetical protein